MLAGREGQHTSVYRYQSPRQYLLDWLSERQKNTPDFSVRKWAKEMDLSHSLLVLLLQGKRPLRLKHAPSLSRGLKFTAQERLYFQALIEFDCVNTPEEKDLLRVWLSDLNPELDWNSVEVDEFKMISNWIHTAILAMTSLPGFELDPEWIHKRLKSNAGLFEVKAAVSRLEGLGLLKRGEDGKIQAAFRTTTTTNDRKDLGAREYFKQIGDLAKSAIDGQEIFEREIQSFSLAIPKEKMELAKTLIRKFRSQFAQTMETSGEPDEVYQMHLTFFRLTESPRELVPSEDEGAKTKHGSSRGSRNENEQ